MEGLALVGVSHRRGGAAALEEWQRAFGPEPHRRLLERGVQEFVPIVTCNRFDVVLALPEGLDPGQMRRRLSPANSATRPYAFVADGAVEQLSRIAASLDSLNPGEDQIMRQVREAYRTSRAAGTTGQLTEFAFDTALRTAKRVRREVELAPLNTSLFSLAVPELERRLSAGDRVAVVGAGEMGALAARSVAALPDLELLIVNRSEGRARRLAESLGAGYESLEDFLRNPPQVAALVAATPRAGLLDGPLLERLPGLKLIVDLGIPRNADAEAVRRRGVDTLDIDTLQAASEQRRVALGGRLARASEIIQAEVEAARDEWAQRQLGPSIGRLREWYLETIGADLPQEEAARLAHRFAHVPVKGLRAVAREHGIEAARTFLRETGLIE